MNYRLAKEIYGNSPWMIDPISFSGLFSILTDFRNGVKLDFDSENKLNSTFALNVESNTKLVYQKWQLNDLDSDVIAIHKIDGPITKNGGQSSFGMKELSSRMDSMTKDKRVKGHIILSDSGGGATNAIEFMADAIKNSQSEGKPVVQLIEKGGLSASAMFAIGSYSDFILSESPDNIVGSLGTMIEMSGFPKQHTDPEGKVHVRAYATASIDKNSEFEEALKGNLEPIINNILDPVNKKFLSEIKANRPNVTEDQLTGKTFRASEVVGTLIDGIGNMGDAINKVLELSSNSLKASSGKKIESKAIAPKININNKTKKMDLKELKSEHPAVYNEVFGLGLNAGTIAEKDRVGAWMAHSKSDPTAVKAGIDSGVEITATQREELLVKGSRLSHLDDLKGDGAAAVVTAPAGTGTELSAEEKEIAAFEATLDAKLKTS